MDIDKEKVLDIKLGLFKKIKWSSGIKETHIWVREEKYITRPYHFTDQHFTLNQYKHNKDNALMLCSCLEILFSPQGVNLFSMSS